ncbi:MAG TPA: type II secretion system major pseudopilin GspG [Thermodesulfovibrionales bacterium]|nr:type II secretion system major pseudopilin GspG [Thermodesulfovibrionales bacterium]
MKIKLGEKDLRNQRGFTLVELLIVMVIIGMLAALVYPRLTSKVGKGKQSAAKAQIELLGQALDQFKLDTGRYPTTSEGLNALMVNPGVPNWDGPYLRKAVPNDPWGRPYHYEYPGSHGGDYDIFSYGADGSQGGEDENKDIGSWGEQSTP